MKYISQFFMLVMITACGTGKSDTQQQGGDESIQTDKKTVLEEKIGPFYETRYHPDSVELEAIGSYEKIDEVTAIRILTNVCKEIKADYLNYLMDSYKTVDPMESDKEPMFDAEHIGKFIVWQFVKHKTECFSEIFKAMGIIFEKADTNALALAKYGVYQTIILESKKQDVNYNSAYNPWLSEKVKEEWFLLIDEMESGRS